MLFCISNLEDWSHFGETFGGILGPVIAGIAAILLLKTLNSQNDAINLQHEMINLQHKSLALQISANDFNTCLTLYHDILDYIDELKYITTTGKTFEGFEAVNKWVDLIISAHKQFTPNSGFGLEVTLLGKDFDECSRKIEESDLSIQDKNFLMDKVGYLYYAFLKSNLEKLIDFFAHSVENEVAIKYYTNINKNIIERRETYHL